jgi:hypothetical protein
MVKGLGNQAPYRYIYLLLNFYIDELEVTLIISKTGFYNGKKKN